MNPAETILAEIGAGPTTVGLKDGDEYDITFRKVDIEGSGFHAEGVAQADEEQHFRIDHPPHSDAPPALERRHAGETEWEELGHVEFASQDG